MIGLQKEDGKLKLTTTTPQRDGDQ